MRSGFRDSNSEKIEPGNPAGEIINADDKELNRWCSLKKTCMFRSEKEEMSDLKNYKIKAQNERKKKEILSSVYTDEEKDTDVKSKVGKKRGDRLKNAEKEGRGGEDEDGSEDTPGRAPREAAGSTGEEDEEEEEEEEVLIPKKKMKRESSEEKPQITAEEEEEEEEEEGGETGEVETRTERPQWCKKKPKRSGGRLLSAGKGVRIGGRDFSRQRLKAYGLNPKRLYFRQLGRQKRKAQEKMEKKKNK